MPGETDLQRLIKGMEPALMGCDWGYGCAAALPEGMVPFATVAEAEGLTILARMDELAAAGIPAQGPMARITLTIHSSLEAVGLTAAVSAALARRGISANMIAGWHHDHIFLPADKAEAAMAALRELAHA
ncbi:MAG TPA: ACT domain-containing protein [Gemmobacter sp.]|nr:ACT domain-containing protein [Gemmobacter sp.]